jgi:hypothetical protein
VKNAQGVRSIASLFTTMSTQTNATQPLKNGDHGTVTGVAIGNQLDEDVTNQVIAATGPKAHARLASIIPSLTRHLHAFMRESQITSTELMAAFDLVGSTQKPQANNVEILI